MTLTHVLVFTEPAFEPYNWSDPLRVETTLLNEEEQQIMQVDHALEGQQNV